MLALLFCLGVAAQQRAVNAQSAEAVPEETSGQAIWPVAFDTMCKTLLAITKNLDKQVAYAKFKGYSCTAEQTNEIGGPGKCNPLTPVSSVLWARRSLLDSKEILINRINAQTECLTPIIVR
ncbi:unnamed protein product [Mortierella alpina]